MPFDKNINMDIQLPPTPPMDLSDSNSNSSNDYKVSKIVYPSYGFFYVIFKEKCH